MGKRSSEQGGREEAAAKGTETAREAGGWGWGCQETDSKHGKGNL